MTVLDCLLGESRLLSDRSRGPLSLRDGVIEDRTGVGDGVGRSREDGTVEGWPRGEGPAKGTAEARPRGGEGVGEVSARILDPKDLTGEGDARRRLPEVRRGEGLPNTSSFSSGTDLGLCRVVPSASFNRSPEGMRLADDKKGDLETYSFLARRPRPVDVFAVLLAALASGLSFSLVPDTFLSLPLVGNAIFRSEETLRVPFSADPGLLFPELGVREPDRTRADEALAVIPRPMAAFGVAAAPKAFSGEAPSDRTALRSWMIESAFVGSTQMPAACWPCTVTGDLNGELDTSEFFVTCLKDELVRRGDTAELRVDGDVT